jgi:hypothetical protein
VTPRSLPCVYLSTLLLLLLLWEAFTHQVGGGALAAVHAVKVGGHEDARAALGALLPQAGHLAGVVHLCECVESVWQQRRRWWCVRMCQHMDVCSSHCPPT